MMGLYLGTQNSNNSDSNDNSKGPDYWNKMYFPIKKSVQTARSIWDC